MLSGVCLVIVFFPTTTLHNNSRGSPSKEKKTSAAPPKHQTKKKKKKPDPGAVDANSANGRSNRYAGESGNTASNQPSPAPDKKILCASQATNITWRSAKPKPTFTALCISPNETQDQRRRTKACVAFISSFIIHPSFLAAERSAVRSIAWLDARVARSAYQKKPMGKQMLPTRCEMC